MSRRALREAPRYLAAVAAVELALAVAGLRLGGRLLLAAGAALLFFFRDPERPLEPDEDVAYAPADGTVMKVDEVRDPWVPGEEATRITTFLSLHNVHVTRSPVGGRIAGEEDTEGGYRPAFLPRSEANRRRRLAIDGRRGRVVVVQIAGLVARRITSWVSPGDDLAPGQRLGLIHFGSRTDVLLPAGSADVLVSAGQRVRAGQSPLARYRELAA
jgi:phosphatidylserine decarboxylase